MVEFLRVFRHVGFFCSWRRKTLVTTQEGTPMKKLDPTMAQQVAQAGSAFQQRQTGYAPKAVTVVLRNCQKISVTTFGVN